MSDESKTIEQRVCVFFGAAPLRKRTGSYRAFTLDIAARRKGQAAAAWAGSDFSRLGDKV